MQVVPKRWDGTFSAPRYGFGPGRSAHQAVKAAPEYIAAGYRGVGDLHVEKFFERVDPDQRMAKSAERVSAQRLWKLIRALLRAGVREGGRGSPGDEGTPQGGPLSPLLSNIVRDEFERELERRGQRFARYADDRNLYVRSRRAGGRGRKSLTRFIGTKLKLRVNEAKSAGGRPWERKFGGFSFTHDRKPKRRIAPQALPRFRERARELTRRRRGISRERRAKERAQYLQGWIGYFGKCQTPAVLHSLEEWTRRR
jgi:RNA-directed DNA polymerase